MQTYHPKISVWLTHGRPRKLLADTVSADGRRYRQTPHGFDLTPLLGTDSVVEVRKSVRDATGTFMLSFPDRSVSLTQGGAAGFDSLAAFIEPMDSIEIRLSHSGTTDTAGRYPLVLRGFVTSVARSESIANGVPQRMVRVTGHDYGKVLQLIRLVSEPNGQLDGTLKTVLAYFTRYAKGTEAKTKTVGQFMQEVADVVINPYLQTMVGQAGQVLKQMAVQADVAASVSVSAKSLSENISLLELLRGVLDVPAFNELYVEDSEAGATLVVRPIPLKDTASGRFLQGEAVQWRIDDKDIEQLSTERSDAGVANYFAVSSRAHADVNQTLTAEDVQTAQDRLGYVNSASAVFGFRAMRMETALLPNQYVRNDNPKKAVIAGNTQKLADYLRSQSALLAAMNRDNVILDSGALQLRGDERLKPGCYLKLYRGGRYMGEVYAHTISHRFTLYQSFVSSIVFDRGTLFYERAKAEQSLYPYEQATGGIV
ncbi:hypothetical protein KFZ76_19830 [Methylovulum psychrotolerans]|uniref:hypothetical protein n=1 Tax=Methylovulum psychrotolerans TaxID=1704499 RepID=UPI001BFFBC7F|nr:hypothetical protein [Methylovulum psychrotolerans]MBT9099953.1 hypothetical protein [Methylovulum psychrotolerans]